MAKGNGRRRTNETLSDKNRRSALAFPRVHPMPIDMSKLLYGPTECQIPGPPPRRAVSATYIASAVDTREEMARSHLEEL